MTPRRSLRSSTSAWQFVPGGSTNSQRQHQHQQQQQQQHEHHHQLQQHYQQLQRHLPHEVHNNSDSGGNRTEENANNNAPPGYMNPLPPPYISHHEGQLPPYTGPPGSGGGYVFDLGYDDPARTAMPYARPPSSEYQYGGRHDLLGQCTVAPVPQSGFLGYNTNPASSGLYGRAPPPYLSSSSSSFVPGYPGAHEAKRRRRRPEEIERIYQCGWEGCTKGYGTLNHLNAHVTMQGHGVKRLPEGKTTTLSPHSSLSLKLFPLVFQVKLQWSSNLSNRWARAELCQRSIDAE